MWNVLLICENNNLFCMRAISTMVDNNDQLSAYYITLRKFLKLDKKVAFELIYWGDFYCLIMINNTKWFRNILLLSIFLAYVMQSNVISDCLLTLTQAFILLLDNLVFIASTISFDIIISFKSYSLKLHIKKSFCLVGPELTVL